jgi:DNA-binding MarR family transcriptional regulator
MGDEPRWLNDEEMAAWTGFLGAGALLNRRIEQQLREDSGLSHTQYEILVRLNETPDGALRMTELADALLNSKSGLTYQMTQLEKAGLTGRRSCDWDVRGVIAYITDEGRAKLEAAAPGHAALVRELLIDVLTPEQVKALGDGLGEVKRRLVQDKARPNSGE